MKLSEPNLNSKPPARSRVIASEIAYAIGSLIAIVAFLWILAGAVPHCFGQEPSPRLVGVTIEPPRETDGWHSDPSNRVGKWRQVSLSTVPQSVIRAASATVRVRFPAGNGDNVGTGVYLGDGLYLTAFHVGRGTSGKGTVSFRDGGYDQAVAVKSDPDADLLLLQGSIRAEMPCVALHDANLQQGDMAFLAGTAKGSLDMWHGPVTGYWDTDTGASDWMSIDGSATEGDSGGPVFTETGRLCGVLWGGDGRETMASNCGRIRRFLLPWNARLAAWQESQCQGSVCYPSQIQHQQQRLPTAPNRQTIPSTGQPTPVPSGVARQPSASPSVPQISDEAIAAHIFDQMKDHSALFKGEKGDKGEPGPKGDPGSPGEPASITESDIERIAVAVLQAIPPTVVRAVDPNSGEATDLGIYKPGMAELELPLARDSPIEITDEMIANIAKRLPPVILQPTWKGKDGETLRTDSKLVGKLGEPIDVPPVTLNVHGRNGKTIANGPIGGHVAFKLGESE